MTIKVGEKIPTTTLFYMGADGPTKISSDELFAGKKVVVFGLPGAFTPTCSAGHLPGFVIKSDELKAKGIDSIICLSVNDAYVMNAWGERHNAEGAVMMIADGNGDFTRKLGLEADRTKDGMGIRSKRYAMIVDNGTVSLLNLEETGKFEVSDAETILKAL